MGILVNIDNGGTFTDVCVKHGDRVIHAKSPTTPHDLTLCFVGALTRASRKLYGDDDLGRFIRETDYLRYSTTSGTNAVVERKGTPAALIVEKGEEASVYGLTERLGKSDLWAAMVPLAPAGLAVRGGAGIDEKELTAVVNGLLTAGAQRIVVALRTEAAEIEVKRLLLDRYPRHLLGAVPFLISYELVNDTNHQRRIMSAVLNSYLHPGMEHFLYGAEGVCKKNHLAHPLLIYRNDGNSARVAKTAAIKTWGSGPRGGVEGALAYARLYDVETLVAMDIGGTTTDVAIIADGAFRLDAHGHIEAAQTSFPLPDMQSHGLGGSSIIAVDKGKIRIGPESLGAAPGPACFGRGGTQVTLTDALLLAGVIDGETYLGGELRLDSRRAESAIRTHIADPLKMTVAEAVDAVVKAFEAEVGKVLADAVRAAGRDPAKATLLAFGGGGPMIATGIAAAAGMRRVIVPHMAAVFSAFGIGFSNLAHEYHAELPGNDRDAIEQLQERLTARAKRDMYGEGVDSAACRFESLVWSERDGQVEETPITGADDLRKLKIKPNDRLALRAVYDLPVFALAKDSGKQVSAPVARGTATIRGAGKDDKVDVLWAGDLVPGHAAKGPLLLRDEYLTCFLREGWSMRVTDNNDLTIERN